MGIIALGRISLIEDGRSMRAMETTPAASLKCGKRVGPRCMLAVRELERFRISPLRLPIDLSVHAEGYFGDFRQPDRGVNPLYL